MAGYTPPSVSFTPPSAEADNPYSAKFYATQPALKAGGQKANSEGLAESGVLAQRQGVTQTGYAQKAGALGTSRRNAIEKYQNDASTKLLGYGEKTAGNVADAESEALKYAEEHPPAPPEPAATPSAASGGSRI